MNEKNHLFSNHALKMLLIPLIAEQFLTSLMGTADSMTGRFHQYFGDPGFCSTFRRRNDRLLAVYRPEKHKKSD